MKFFLPILIFFGLLIPSLSFADEHDEFEKNQWFLGFGVGGGINAFDTGGLEITNSTLVNGRVGRSTYFRFMRGWRVDEEIQVEGSTDGFKAGPEFLGDFRPQVNMVTMTANTRVVSPPLFTTPVLGPTSAFAVGGLGLSNGNIEYLGYSVGTTEFAGRVGGGLLWQMSDSFDLTFEASEVFQTGQLSGLDYTSLTANVLWRF